MHPTREKGLAYIQKVISAKANEEVPSAVEAGHYAVSKFYKAGESWTNSPVWWFDIAIKKVKNESIKVFLLLCQKPPTSEDFYILVIPKKVFIENMRQFEIRKKKTIRLHLSAEADNIFTDIRGDNFDFSKFCINQP